MASLKFSPTKLAAFQRCPQQYAFQYLLRIPRAPTAAMTFGSNLHRTLQGMYESGGPQGEDQAQAVARLSETWSGQGFADKKEEAAFKALGESIISQFHTQFQVEEGRPLLIEKRLEAPYKDIKFFGIVDRVDLLPDGSLDVIDYKSTRYVATDVAEVEAGLRQQLSLYAFLARYHLPYPVRRLSIHYLRTNERLSFAPEAIDPDAWVDHAYRTTEAIQQATAAEAFPAMVTDSCQWCPYAGRCPAWRDARRRPSPPQSPGL